MPVDRPMASNRHHTHPLARLEFSSRVRKRAQYEAYEFTLTTDGVRVRNTSYADPENHEYHVAVEDGLPVACTCPADRKFEGACKHRVAVAIRRPVLDACVERQAVADGGQVGCHGSEHKSRIPAFDRESRGDPEVDGAEDEPCEVCAGLGSLLCWECFRIRVRRDQQQ